MSDYNWEFPSNNDGGIEGFNDTGLRSFRGEAGSGLAIRECIQNSIDARRDSNLPVRVDITVPSIPFKDFPDIQGFKNILDSCLKSKYNEGHKNIQQFYSHALRLIKGEFIHCDLLRISDYNTTGLKTELFEEVFIKGSGITVKETPGSAGAHGIGKIAIFALSQFRTAFYSTIDVEGSRSFIGKSILQSHTRSDGTTSQGKGYYAKQPGHKPITKKIDELSFLGNRTEPGLDIFITAFNKTDETKDSMIVAVIESFYPAIHNSNLIVNVMGQAIDAKTLPNLVKKYSENKYQKFYLRTQKDSFPLINFYETLISSQEKFKENLVESTLSINEDNDVLIKTLKSNGTNKVHYHRLSGMIVKIDRRRSPLKLTTIVAIQGNKLNIFLKQLENVSHDDWQVSQIDGDDDVKAEAKRILSLISEAIQENINQFYNQDSSDEIDMSGAAKYLQDDLDIISNQKQPSDDIAEEDDLEKTITEKHKNFIIKKPKAKIAKKNKDGLLKKYGPDDEGGDEEYEPGDGGTSRKKNKTLTEKDEGDIEKPDFQSYALNKTRLIESMGDGHYAFALSSNDHINCYFLINALSEDGNENILQVEECLSGNESFEINNRSNIVGPIELKANQEVIIHLSLKDKTRMALQLNAFVDNNE